MKIYIISKGKVCDDDYRICGVSLEEQKAEQIARFCSTPNDQAEVEEFDTKAYESVFQGYKMYDVYKNGDTLSAYETSPDNIGRQYKELNIVIESPYDKNTAFVVVSAKNKDEALKKGKQLIGRKNEY